MKPSKSWFITGCDRGMGYIFAETFLRHGDTVVVTARDKSNVSDLLKQYPDTAIGLELDVTDSEAIHQVVKRAEMLTGGIDVLINNAGYGLLGPVEATSPDEYRALFEVNFFGAAEVMRAVLPFMRQRRQGYIINTTSIGGFAASPGFGFYAASKFAMEGLSESVALDTAVFGIKVTILEPGSTRTEFAGESMNYTSTIIEEYQSSAVKTTVDRMTARHGSQPGDPRRLAKVLLKFSRMDQPPLRFTTGEDGLGRMRQKLDATSKEAEKFAHLSLGVAYESINPEIK